MKKVNILGTEYTIEVKNYDEDEVFASKSIIGYSDDLAKKIVIADAKTFPNWEKEAETSIEACNKETLRHEIIHAFLHESGLKDCSIKWNGAWAKNEEMVDWIAIQFPKILQAFKETGCL
jgi:hypothetical protein